MACLTQFSFIFVENPDLGIKEIIKRSIKMMQGRKRKLFDENMSFIGLAFLATLTLTIGYLWVLTYYATTMA